MSATCTSICFVSDERPGGWDVFGDQRNEAHLVVIDDWVQPSRYGHLEDLQGGLRFSIGLDEARVGTPREQLEDLVKALGDTSPIRDTIANPVTVITRLA